MPFPLSRGSNSNVISEVQRWQYFLRRMKIPQVGQIDGDFGQKTEDATRIFQLNAGLATSGKVTEAVLTKARDFGYTVLPSDHYKGAMAAPGFPPKLDGLASPSNATRNATFGCFSFKQQRRDARPDAEAIVIGASCDGSAPSWTKAIIIDIEVPQLAYAQGYNGRVTCHRLAADPIRALFAEWEKADLMHLVISYAGCFVPRYIRGSAPRGDAGHGPRKSTEISSLSNHSFGSAFDINAPDNPRGSPVQKLGRRGCLRELVPAAQAHGFYWGGFFGTVDGMHFELARF